MKYSPENLFDALNVTSCTLVGFIGDEYPMKSGNCFSVNIGEAGTRRIINFNHENLEELIARKIVEFPIKVLPLSEGHALIADERIPDEWYSDRFCETCTPHDLLPPQQKLKYMLDKMRGDIEESSFEFNGQQIKLISVNVKSKPGIVYVPWTPEPISEVEAYQDPNAEEELTNLLKSEQYNRKIDSSFYGSIDIKNDDDNK